MEAFREYWTFSSIRGAMTMLAAFFIVLVPQAAVSIMGLNRPFGLAVDCLATYCWLDAGVLVLLAILLPKQATHRKLFYVQAGAEMLLGGLFYAAVGIPTGTTVMAIASSLAICAGGCEWAIGLDTHREYGLRSCYTNAVVLAACALLLPFTAALDVDGLCVALGVFVAIYGFSQLTSAGSMLFLEYRQDHPATSLADNWTAPPAAAACVTCSGCPAEATCSDFSLEGQIARIWAQQHPSIVRAMKVGRIVNGLKAA